MGRNLRFVWYFCHFVTLLGLYKLSSPFLAGLYSRYVVRFSLSGLPRKSDLIVGLDEKDIHWEPKDGIGLDRWHYDIHINETLEAGVHTIAFSLKNKSLVGVAQLCSVEIIEFGSVDEYVL